ncbi:MAG: archease [Gaiellales bacterium]|nr:MAG: archease [Gaiellales bacterium]
MKAFETIEHTADIGIRAFGSSREEVFENAATGMFSLITDLESVKPLDEYPVSVEAEDEEALLVEWLNELLYLYDSNSILFSRFRVTGMDANRVRGIALGEPLDPGRHRLDTDIKAVTYHMLRIGRVDGNWSAEVIFDV